MKEACSGHDVVVHLAAIPNPMDAPAETVMTVNVMGTFHVLEGAVASGVKKVVIASTEATLGFVYRRHDFLPAYLPLDEDHPCAPQDSYGLSKRMDELMGRSYWEAFGIITLCLRICGIWYLDAGDVEARYAPFVSNPDALRRHFWVYTDARDAARAFRLAAENTTVDHDTFFITAGDTCSTVKSEALCRQYYPSVPLKEQLPGFSTLISNKKAARILDYRPLHSWRDHPVLGTSCLAKRG